ncbi:glycoside-pentoside-hexuronide (GPH):cation symporter [Kineococcus vitellinus]|uniref:glycoside-pentoside-hexuronide (GPH):cation symporter n=1 Tax=Kineococcus vitellinus TaxID=2696565 RepID=UPI00196B7761
MPLARVFGYASTDTAGNLLYCMVTSFILYYYTDVFGISLAAAGTILLIARIVDAFDAPIWGFIIDRTSSRWGQSRPYWLWITPFFAVFFVMLFWSPDLSAGGKFIWALVTYLLFGIAYTGISTPITSILPNLSNDSGERIKLNSYRMVGGNIGYFVPATFALSLVAFFGSGNDIVGWRWTAVFIAVIGALLLAYAFASTREINTERQRPLPIKQSVQAVRSNWPWVILVAAFILYWLGNSTRTSVLVYFTEYQLGDKNFASVLNGLVLLQVLGMVLIPFAVKKLPKTRVLQVGFLIAAAGQAAMAFAGTSHLALAVCWSLASLGTGIAVSMPFAMLSDTVDYGEWKNGVRAAGFLTAIGSSFCIKIGSGLGGFIPSMIMSAAGYRAGQQQSAAALSAIQFCFAWLPAIFFVAGAAVMLAYRRYERLEPQVRSALAAASAERTAQQASA